MHFTHYHQSGELTLHRMSRFVYDNAPAEKPKPTPTAEQVARGEQPIDEKIVKARTDLIITKLDDTLAKYEKGGAPAVPEKFLKNFQGDIQYLKNDATALNQKFESSNSSTAQKILPIVEKVLPAAPVYDADGRPLTAKEIASGALQYDADGLRNMDFKDTTDDEHAEALNTLNKTETLIANPNGPLKGKVTLDGFQRYIRAGNGIAGDILATSKSDRPSYGTLSYENLTTQDVIISSPQLTVTAIKVLQQNLGLKADGVFGLATYNAIIKRRPAIAAMLRGESPLRTA